MDNILETTQIEIPKKSNIRVIWEDDSENYTQERVKVIDVDINTLVDVSPGEKIPLDGNLSFSLSSFLITLT